MFYLKQTRKHKSGNTYWHLATVTMDRHQTTRKQLDSLLLLDALVSIFLGGTSLLAPHGFVAALSTEYSHNTHEALRLYGCLRIAVGWILFNVRKVDDGRFRRSVCEALCLCYVLQSLAVVRALFTDSSSWHWYVFLGYY